VIFWSAPMLVHHTSIRGQPRYWRKRRVAAAGGFASNGGMPATLVADSILKTIGRTPAVQLRRIVGPASAGIVAKLEFFNPTASYKDRMALAMIEGAEARGALRAGMRVIEFTGGSTGSSLAMVCA